MPASVLSASQYLDSVVVVFFFFNYTLKLETDWLVPGWLHDLFFLNWGLQAAGARAYRPPPVLLRACKTCLN